MTMPENKTTRFAPGVSGNPKGKPRGVRHRATLMVMKLMQDDAKDIVRAVIDSAKGGDMTAARIIIERLAPPLRERPISIALPDTSSIEGIEKAQGVILDAVGAGDLLPGEGTTLWPGNGGIDRSRFCELLIRFSGSIYGADTISLPLLI